MISVDSESFLTVVAVGAIAAFAAGLIAPRLAVPVVVLEIVLGILVGPEVLGLAHPDEFLEFFSSLGLGMLFFFAGYEIDFERIRGSPLRLAVLGWLALAYSLGGLLALTGLVLSLVFTGSALATTAIGTLIPILGDAGELRTRFGTYLLAAGAMGEFGPILLITFVFSTQSAIDNALILVAFIVTAVIAAVVAVRGVVRHWALLERTLETSGQLANSPLGGRRLRPRHAGGIAGPRSPLGRVRRGGDRPHRPQGPRGCGLRFQAHRGRLRLPHSLLLRRERDQLRPQRSDRRAASPA
jgi:Kef-type K+ transport system membrane component KefB